MKQLRVLFVSLSLICTIWLVWPERASISVWAQDPAIPTPTVTLPPTFTPTPRPTPRLITEFVHPKPGDAISDMASIIGSSITYNCFRYQVDIAIADTDNWKFLASGNQCVYNSELTKLDTRTYADGLYDFRLRAVRFDGNYVEAFLRRIEIRNSYPPTATPAYDFLGSPLPTPAITPFPQPSPTQPPLISHQIQGGLGFYKPEIGDTVRGYVDIIGTVNSGTPRRVFNRYELYISPAMANQWESLFSSQEQFWQSPIYTLDTTQYADGYYDLRLRIVYSDGNYDDFLLRYLRIANQTGSQPGSQPENQTNRPLPVPQKPPQDQPPPSPSPTPAPQYLGISSPQDNATVSGIVEVRGRVVDPNFLRWELYWSPTTASDWSFLYSSDHPTAGGLLARLDLSQLANSVIDLRLRIVRKDYNYNEYFARKINVLSLPTPVPKP